MHVGKEGYELKALQVGIMSGFDNEVIARLTRRVPLYTFANRPTSPKRSIIILRPLHINRYKAYITSLLLLYPHSIQWPRPRTVHHITSTRPTLIWLSIKVERSGLNVRRCIAFADSSRSWQRKGKRKRRMRWTRRWTVSRRQTAHTEIKAIMAWHNTLIIIACLLHETTTTREILRHSHPTHSLLSMRMIQALQNLATVNRRIDGVPSRFILTTKGAIRKPTTHKPSGAFPHHRTGH